MAIFKYNAKDMDAKRITGKKEASDRKELAALLRSEGVFLLDCKELQEKEKNTYKMKLKELSDFSRQVGTMIGSGVSLIRTISIMVQRQENDKIKEIYKDMYRRLQQGQTLSVAMEEQGRAFPELMINMYRSGETSGQLEKVAMTMALQYEKDNRINSKIRNAMVYPIILIIITVLVIVAVFTIIIPSFSDIFEGMTLPLITQIVRSISDILVKYWYWIVIGILSIAGLISSLLRVESIRYKVDEKKVHFPKIGKMLMTIYTARFARNMCSLYTSGISILNALAIVKENIGNKYIAQQFDDVIKQVRNGSSLSQSIQKIDGFDVKLASSIYIGEESGKLEDMLSTLADDFDYESELATQKMVSMLEPVMIIFLAVIVLLVMLSVLLPIYQMYQNPTGL